MNFLKSHHNQANLPADSHRARVTPWDALARIPFRPAEQLAHRAANISADAPATSMEAIASPTSDERQQRKIIAGLRYGASFALRSHDVELGPEYKSGIDDTQVRLSPVFPGWLARCRHRLC